MKVDDLANALEVILDKKAERFINNQGYLDHVRKCVKELKLMDPETAFLFGGLDAMQHDFGSATEMTNPPASILDIKYRENRINRLRKWMNRWKESTILENKRRFVFPRLDVDRFSLN